MQMLKWRPLPRKATGRPPVAPPGTPKSITEKINADVNEALRQPELQDRLKKLSAEIFGGSVEKAAKYMREEVERWSEVIKAADVKLQ
jgi:tripartite-type tricarboxylate transporter receptor subunit TctC